MQGICCEVDSGSRDLKAYRDYFDVDIPFGTGRFRKAGPDEAAIKILVS